MWRRSSVGSRPIASRPATKIFPDVGSISRLMSRIIVVLPLPDGPSSTTISPLRIVIVTSSTAALACPGYRLVTSISRIPPRPASSSPAAAAAVPPASRTPPSDTDAPRGRQPPDQDEAPVEQQRQDDDQHRP